MVAGRSSSSVMTDCEKIIVGNFYVLCSNVLCSMFYVLTLYVRCMDNTLLSVNRQDIDKALQAFHGFDHILKFTVYKLENETLHF